MTSPTYPGQRLGLPEEGPSAVAGYGQRTGAFILDCIIAGAITWPFTAPNLPQNWSLITFFVIYTAGTAFLGRTPGMLICRLRLASNREGRMVGPLRAIARTVLLMLIIPALINDSDRRGLHDRVAGTTVIRA